ncbi:MAG: hypothetical protein AUI14_05325 [Actinobacteria bacterium 13_2_20CM_2_71_6]|nr:MAG: hypothetical protein AUI14_05325 [Actinobacteria bacterium 13_2_20CM_2_71_6]
MGFESATLHNGASADGTRIDRLVDAQAAARPTAVAVRWRDEELSYDELVAQSRRVAEGLARLGVTAGDIVAVRVPPRPRLVGVLLGVLRLGAAYTVIPMEWPLARAEEVVRGAAARVCLVADGEEEVPGAPTVSLTGLLCGTAPVLSGPTAPATAPEVACLFFTSGSTGKPKGVLSPHLGTIRIAFDPRLGFGPETVMLQAASVAWDAFALEVWTPLVHGGTVVFAPATPVTGEVIRHAVAQGVNAMFLTTSLFNVTIDDDPGAFEGVELLMVGGERLSPKHMDTPVWLLDASGHPVPAGAAGEVAIGGPGVALGYTGNEAETARKFRTLPLGPDGAPERVYLTGDLAAYDDTGNLVFQGRNDRQIKIRGVRVEPGEVEAAITGLSGVGSATVLPVPVDATNIEGLVAFYTCASTPPVTEEEVRAAVAAVLPSAFVPKSAIRLPALPLNATGKLDRVRIVELLSSHTAAQAVATGDGEQHDGNLGVVLDQVRVLLNRPLTVQADIFDAGATSITAIQLAGRISRATGVTVPVSAVLRLRTPAGIAGFLDDADSDDDELAA